MLNGNGQWSWMPSICTVPTSSYGIVFYLICSYFVRRKSLPFMGTNVSEANTTFDLSQPMGQVSFYKWPTAMPWMKMIRLHTTTTFVHFVRLLFSSSSYVRCTYLFVSKSFYFRNVLIFVISIKWAHKHLPLHLVL